jgi:hypothetical protein
MQSSIACAETTGGIAPTNTVERTASAAGMIDPNCVHPLLLEMSIIAAPFSDPNFCFRVSLFVKSGNNRSQMGNLRDALCALAQSDSRYSDDAIGSAFGFDLTEIACWYSDPGYSAGI